MKSTTDFFPIQFLRTKHKSIYKKFQNPFARKD